MCHQILWVLPLEHLSYLACSHRSRRIASHVGHYDSLLAGLLASISLFCPPLQTELPRTLLPSKHFWPENSYYVGRHYPRSAVHMTCWPSVIWSQLSNRVFHQINMTAQVSCSLKPRWPLWLPPPPGLFSEPNHSSFLACIRNESLSSWAPFLLVLRLWGCVWNIPHLSKLILQNVHLSPISSEKPPPTTTSHNVFLPLKLTISDPWVALGAFTFFLWCFLLCHFIPWLFG